MMQFGEFVSAVQNAVGSASGASYTARDTTVSWTAEKRQATVALVPPLNVSVTLRDAVGEPVTNWYPIDAALVSVVSNRVTGFLGKA